tara:strand:- start:535 stop:1047 length:513 start_codon:yes stop_codon:yes gene_type:complete
MGGKPEYRIADWKRQIVDSFVACVAKTVGPIPYNNPTNEVEAFLSTIWKMSMEAFDIPREVQVVVDNQNKLFINVGTPSFVSFDGADEEELEGMKIPFKCWIHTHPFGEAYFSRTDWDTINTWKPLLSNAIVLGDNEYWAYDVTREIVKQVKYGLLQSPPIEIEEITEEE